VINSPTPPTRVATGSPQAIVSSAARPNDSISLGINSTCASGISRSGAAKPPRTIFRTVAARLGRTIMYIPIGQLSPVSLKRIRVVHVLDGYDKRDIARDYIR
jgi:hypothetical protein